MFRRNRRLVCFDILLIQTEVIDELAGGEQAAITAAMNGEIDFKESLKAHGFARV
jgi:hypothetical protein